MSANHFGLIIAGKKTSIPLRDVSVSAEIKGYVLGLKSVLTYVNDTSDPIEVLFRFPLEDSHAVVGLTAVIDGRKIKAEIREKEEARAAYDDAIASGQSAALGEEKSGDVFSITLGNLPPQKNAQIHLELVGELPIDAENKIRFSLPSTLKPRYTPTGSVDPLAPISGASDEQVERSTVSGVGGFELSILNASSQLADVTSPTHSLKMVRDSENDRMIVSLAEEKSLDKDLVIQLEHKDIHQPTVLVETGKDGDGNFMNDQAVTLNFFPDFEQKEAACEFIFLIDRSGSMSGSYIKSARETLILFMKSLPENSHFNIIGFGSRFEKLFPNNSVSYTQETLDTAMAHLQNLQADLGGTELLSPLDAIFRSPTVPGFSRQVFVLTDGSVSNTDRCIQKVKEYSTFSRCFTFGIGSGASSSLVEGLAKAGNGSAEFVKGGERMQPKVIRSLKRALQPSVTDVSVEFAVSGQECKVQQSPDKLPPIYNGEKLVVYGVISAKLPLNGTATLKGRMGDTKIEQQLSFEIQPTSNEHSLFPIHHLAAKALIKDWQSQRKDKGDIVKLSIEGSVISSHTAFIAVNEESSEAISSALKTYDLQASSVQADISSVQSLQQQQTIMAVASSIDQLLQRGERLEDIQCQSESLQLNAASFNRSATRSKGSGGLGGFFSNLFGGKSKKQTSSEKAPRTLSSQTNSSALESACMNECMGALEDSDDDNFGEERMIADCMDECMSDDDDSFCSDEIEEGMALEKEMLVDEDMPMALSAAMPSPKSAASAPPKSAAKKASAPPKSTAKNSPSVPNDILTALVNAQQANGSWAMNPTFATYFGKSTMKELEDSCPKDIPMVVWSTVLVLLLLKKRFSGQEEEWELIAMKANSWLKKQAIPTAVDNLFKTAETIV